MSFSITTSALFRIALAALFVFAFVRFLTAPEAPVAVPPASATAIRSTTAQPARTASSAFSVTVSDADLTSSAAAGFPQTVNGVTVTDPQVHIESDRVRLVARAKILFGTTDFVMTATPTVANGQLDVRVDTATLAGFSVPTETRASIQQTVQATIAQFVPASVKVTSVSLAPGTLTVQGTQR